MKTEEIDKIIERYAEERKHEERQVAQQHFLAYTYIVCRADEVEQFLTYTRGLLVYYMNCLSLFENPFRNTQVMWLLLIFLLFGFSIFMMTNDDLYMLGIILCTGTVIYGTTLWKIVWAKWRDANVLMACYKEIIDLIDNLLAASSKQQSA